MGKNLPPQKREEKKFLPPTHPTKIGVCSAKSRIKHKINGQIISHSRFVRYDCENISPIK
jgi:hypothetical protein